MARYDVPRGYTYDANTGLFVLKIFAVDEDGDRCAVITRFNAESGQYDRIIQPIIYKRAPAPVPMMEPEPVPVSVPMMEPEPVPMPVPMMEPEPEPEPVPVAMVAPEPEPEPMPVPVAQVQPRPLNRPEYKPRTPNSPSDFVKTQQGPQQGGIDFNKKMRNKIILEVLLVVFLIMGVGVAGLLGVAKFFGKPAWLSELLFSPKAKTEQTVSDDKDDELWTMPEASKDDDSKQSAYNGEDESASYDETDSYETEEYSDDEYVYEQAMEYTGEVIEPDSSYDHVGEGYYVENGEVNNRYFMAPGDVTCTLTCRSERTIGKVHLEGLAPLPANVPAYAGRREGRMFYYIEVIFGKWGVAMGYETDGDGTEIITNADMNCYVLIYNDDGSSTVYAEGKEAFAISYLYDDVTFLNIPIPEEYPVLPSIFRETGVVCKFNLGANNRIDALVYPDENSIFENEEATTEYWLKVNEEGLYEFIERYDRGYWN